MVGNCQAAFTAKYYREWFGAPNLEDVRYVDDYGLDNDAAWAAVGQADLVLLQQRDFSSPLPETAPAGAEVCTFPLVLEAFLWPYAHEAHVWNKPEPPLVDGPYPAQLGDKFLNRMITQGVSPEAALEQYLAHDIVGATHIDRLYELHVEQQRDRDERTGFAIAPILEARFRTEPLFMSPHHPNAWMFGVFQAQLFHKLGLDADVIEAMQQSLYSSPFPSGELPLHPGVIRHFGLQFADDGTRYTFHDEGRFTFEEHVLRYMRYAHNRDLRVGMHLFHEARLEQALPHIVTGLEASPLSAHGWRAKGLSLSRLGRVGEAVEPFRRAVEVSPDDAEARAELAHALLEVGEAEDALAIARAAAAARPYHGRTHLVLSQLLHRRGEFAEAAEEGREACRLLPGEWFAFWCTASAYWHAGDHVTARMYGEKAVRLEPTAPDPRNLVAETFERDRRRPEALAVLEEGVSLGGANDQSFSLLGHLHFRKGLDDPDQADRSSSWRSRPSGRGSS